MRIPEGGTQIYKDAIEAIRLDRSNTVNLRELLSQPESMEQMLSEQFRYDFNHGRVARSFLEILNRAPQERHHQYDPFVIEDVKHLAWFLWYYGKGQRGQYDDLPAGQYPEHLSAREMVLCNIAVRRLEENMYRGDFNSRSSEELGGLAFVANGMAKLAENPDACEGLAGFNKERLREFIATTAQSFGEYVHSDQMGDPVIAALQEQEAKEKQVESAHLETVRACQSRHDAYPVYQKYRYRPSDI